MSQSPTSSAVAICGRAGSKPPTVDCSALEALCWRPVADLQCVPVVRAVRYVRYSRPGRASPPPLLVSDCESVSRAARPCWLPRFGLSGTASLTVAVCVVACVLVAVAGCNAFIRYDDAGNPKLLPEGAKVDLEFYGDGWHVSQQQSTADDIRNSSLSVAPCVRGG